MQFRKDINGLRAIAVIAVMLFHFNASWLPGGFAGVDVFFVISGFLMTSIIFRGFEQDNFSILKFYVARANRIIPALALLCLALLIFGWFYLTPLDYKTLGIHVASSAGFLSNLIYLNESGYFDAASHEKWLLHTWSLSVEWQFYIIYPVVLMLLRRLMSINTLKLSVLIGTLLGFMFSIVATHFWVDSAYYLLPARSWEMMLGGLAYLYPLTLKNSHKKYVEYLGFSLIICTYLFASNENSWPGFLALIPVLGAFLVIQAQQNDSLLTSNLLFQKIGSWSYSIYLWHWPFVVAIYYFSLDPIFIYLGITLSILLGFISYTYVERIKFKNNFNSLIQYIYCKPIYITLIIGISGSILFITQGVNSPIRHGASTPQAQFLHKHVVKQYQLGEEYWFKCNTYYSIDSKNTWETDPSCLQEQGGGGIFLWGDSHAEAFSLGIRRLIDPLNIPFYQKTSAGCQASTSKTTTQIGLYKQACDHSNELALTNIEKLKPQVVIISQKNDHDKNDWDQIYNQLASFGVQNILLIGPVSQWQPSLPKVMTKSQHWNTESIYINDSGLDLSVINTDTAMKQRTLPSGVTYISLIDSLCKYSNGKHYCRSKLEDGSLFQVDYGHLSLDASVFVVEHLLSDQILKTLK